MPTWNYVAVHVYVTARVIEDEAEFYRLLDSMVTHYESGKAKLPLGITIHDPLAEIEVVEILGAIYVECDIDSRCRTLAR